MVADLRSPANTLSKQHLVDAVGYLWAQLTQPHSVPGHAQDALLADSGGDTMVSAVGGAVATDGCADAPDAGGKGAAPGMGRGNASSSSGSAMMAASHRVELGEAYVSCN